MKSAATKLELRAARTTILFSTVVFLLMLGCVTDSRAQKKFVRTYPAGKNVKLQLTNRTGTVTVEGWDREQVQISAYLESPAATIEPEISGANVIINVVKANQGKLGVGSVNFTVRLPFSSSVDIETVMGNLNVANMRGALVRAHISSEGDITLQNIASTTVSAENVIGDIFFDGDLRDDGNYRFTSMRGNINLRIPAPSSFRFIATAPSARNISLGAFSAGPINFTPDGRRVFGRIGDGGAMLNVSNQRGSITFIRK